tara:strand:+ start:92 stop:418 length:327 start_codon:yes stop_codon:yes gene_type:complete
MTNEGIDKSTLEEGADWIAEMASEDLNGFIPSELCDLIIETELVIREEKNDPMMSHQSMATLLYQKFESDPDIPTQEGAITEFLIREILYWEDEFRSMAGYPRKINPS